MSRSKVVEEIQEPQDLLREILQKYGITQTQIAEVTGISQSRLSRYLRQLNKCDMQLSTLRRIISALPAKAAYEFWSRLALLEIDRNSEFQSK